MRDRLANSSVTIIIFFLMMGMLAGAYTVFTLPTDTIPCPNGQTTANIVNTNGQTLLQCIPSNNVIIRQVTVGENTVSLITTTTGTSSQSSNTNGCVYSGNPFYIFCVLDSLSNIAYCDLTALTGNPCSPTDVNNAVAGNNQFSGAGSSATTSNNLLISILSSPFNQAMIVLGLFIGLGLLAGIFGAGILAATIAVAGIVLSMITYIEGVMGAFGTIPAVVLIPIQAMIGAFAIILIYETLRNGGVK